MASAFYGAANMDLLATDTPNLAGVTDLSAMFRGATRLVGASANWDWNTANVTNMGSMFYSACAFNQPLDTWNTSSVTNMNSMFTSARAFNQPLNAWNMTKVTNASGMFTSAKLSTLNYDLTLRAWNAQALKPGVAFGGGNSTYCLAEPDRTNMAATDTWNITDGGKNCSAYKPTSLTL